MHVEDRFNGFKVLDNELLKKARKQRGFTMKTLASRLGKKSASTVCHYEKQKYKTGKGLPDLSTFKNLCIELNLDANTLLGLEILS